MKSEKQFFVSVRVRPWLSVVLIFVIFAICGVRSYAGESLKEKAIKLGFDKIVFAKRAPGQGQVMQHWYENIGHNVGNNHKNYGGKGGWLYCLSLKNNKLTTIMKDLKGDIRDPYVHNSGEKILFAYRKGGTDQFHLCEINPDGTNFKKITNHSYYDDIEPIYLPNDDIVFVSTRSNHYIPCWNCQGFTIFRCSPNGENITAISANTAVDNTPWLMNDGRILMMQWDYVNKSQMKFHHAFTVNPDGTGRKVFFGGMVGGGVFIDAKPLPNSQKVVFAFSPGHGLIEHAGEIGINDPAIGPDTAEMYSFGKRTKIILDKKKKKQKFVIKKAKELGYKSKMLKIFTTGYLLYRDPYPLSQELFLVATGDRIILVDIDSNVEILYDLQKGNDFSEILGELGNNYNEMWLHEPRPLKSRKPKPMIPSVVNPNNKMGTMILADIYRGRNMIGVEKGSIKKLLVFEDIPKPINDSGGTSDIGQQGSFFLHKILGTVPVEDDGSAYFEVPANSALWFVALDKYDNNVKWMQNFVNLMPGETVGCVGCHENRTETYTSTNFILKALTRPISKISKIEGIPDILDYPRDIQPIWDKHCISCHNSEKRTGEVEMTSDLAPRVMMSLDTLVREEQYVDSYKMNGNRSPRVIGTGGSKLMNKIDGSHHNVKLSELELTTIKVWLDSGPTYSGTNASLDGHMNGRYNHAKLTQIAKKNCIKCHKKYRNKFFLKKSLDDGKREGTSGIKDPLSLVNLTHLEKSVLLRKPLAVSAGGLAEKENHPVIFKSTENPVYKEIYAVLNEMKEQRFSGVRFDTPNYVVGPNYIREMKAYGILPKDIKAEDVDPYETDKKYIESFHPENKK